jgi:hypothetical protein
VDFLFASAAFTSAAAALTAASAASRRALINRYSASTLFSIPSIIAFPASS